MITKQGIKKQDTNLRKSDQDLQGIFSRIRSEDQALAPPFAKTWLSAYQRVQKKDQGSKLNLRQTSKLLAALGTVAAVLVLSFWWIPHNQSTLKNGDFFSWSEKISSWQAPTSSLLTLSSVTQSEADSFYSLITWNTPTDSLIERTINESFQKSDNSR